MGADHSGQLPQGVKTCHLQAYSRLDKIQGQKKDQRREGGADPVS